MPVAGGMQYTSRTGHALDVLHVQAAGGQLPIHAALVAGFAVHLHSMMASSWSSTAQWDESRGMQQRYPYSSTLTTRLTQHAKHRTADWKIKGAK